MKLFLLTVLLPSFLTGAFQPHRGIDLEKKTLKTTASPVDTLQDKITSLWKKTRDELTAVPIDAKVEQVSEGLPFRKYAITIRSLDNVTVAGFLSIPVQGEAPAKPWPVIVTAPGYSGNALSIMLGECQRGYAILQVFPRGQGESAKYFTLKGDKLSTRLDTPEGAYYKSAYADMIRMIDYVVTRPDVDSSRIAMVGTSQGGGISLAITALDSRIKAVVAHVPFLCNMRLAATIPNSLVKKLLDRAHTNSEPYLSTLDYFDPLQLASRIHVPVLMSAGGKDETCPMETVRSVYDRIHSGKELRIYPNLPHTSCQDFYNQSWLWLETNFKNGSPKKNRKKAIVTYWKAEN